VVFVRKRDIQLSSASEQAFPGVLGEFLVANFLKKRGIVIHTNSLASCQLVLSQRRATLSDVSFQTKSSECLVTVELTHYTYTPLIETLCFLNVFAHHSHGHPDRKLPS